ncbi:GH39 family glycosyl hydrolase [Pseudobacteroides cellulosolvens]|uniref:Transcriptional regulator with cupin sensor, AraC family n=1 Tax=Pseudobacteroides cellulosolvens ATCC 35603 = DSM 2933 TaxID=398512 RepID=A0A0L6JQN4_9FIRM|nr:helix-turn-helix domain-containing protein [Pseudobacteroides cellulosolvens]KNY28151.1 transcriptional regulator with cupin sensor, AraC family [Pseudobacteroides cellulosolvens ATCC 35603 = DSM 2933]
MHYTYEAIEYKNNIPYNLFINKVGQVQRHLHQSIEILLILTGNIQVIVEDKSYFLSEEDVILINSNNVHELFSENCTMLGLQIDLSQFESQLIDEKKVLFECNSAEYKNKDAFNEIRSLLARLFKISVEKYGSYEGISTNEILRKAVIYKLLYVIAARFKSDKAPNNQIQTQKNVDRMEKILNYINNHYHENVTLNKLAEMEQLSAAYLSRYFEKNMSINFLSYLHKVRLAYAANEIISTDLHIDTIAQKTGFPNARALTSSFKKAYGMLPSLYRKQNQLLSIPLKREEKSNSINYNDIEQSDYLPKLMAYLPERNSLENEEFDNKGLYLECQIDISKPGKKLCRSFKNLLSFGRTRELLYGDIQEILKTIQKEIGFEYIKLNDIISDDFVCIDKIIDFLLSIKLKPFILYSFISGCTAKANKENSNDNIFIISSPKDIENFTYIVNKLTRHFIERYGIYEVSTWLFALYDISSSNESEDLSLEVYKTAYQSIKSINHKLRFGSPSFDLMKVEESTSSIKRFVDFYQDNGCEPDFINFILYHNVKAYGGNGISPVKNINRFLNHDPDILKAFFDSLKMLFKNKSNIHRLIYLDGRYYVSSYYDLLNDTSFAACYTVKNILENYDDSISFAFWNLSDFHEKSSIGLEAFHGGAGLFNYNGIKKPSYHALYLLNKLGDTVVAQGKGYFMTKGQGNLQMMLYNYIHPSESYIEDETTDKNSADRYKQFLDPVSREFGIELKSIENGSYIIKEYIINRNYSSCFDKWLEMGALTLANQEEVELLKSLSNIMQKKTMIDVVSNSYIFNFVLQPHEIKFVEMRRL